MARRQPIEIAKTLKRLLPKNRIAALAKKTGAVKRERRIGSAPFVLSLVLGFGVGNERTLAGLRRAFEHATGTTVVASSFYDRFSPGLVKLLKALVNDVMGRVSKGEGKMRGVLAQFKDVLLSDSTIIRLHDLLQPSFPACRTNHTLAAIKAHVVMSVRGLGHARLKLTAERVHDGPVLRAGTWVKDRLLLFDKGYYRFQLFACIHRQGGFFITRLKDKANPMIIGQHLTWRGASVAVVGQRLQAVLGRLKRDVIDLQVDLRFHKRAYNGKRSGASFPCRLVGIKNPVTGAYWLYVTNIPPSKLDAHDIGMTYSARWLVELFFRELKTSYRLDQMPSSKRHVVEALIYAALLTMIASRVLLEHFRALVAVDLRERLPEERWAGLFAAKAEVLLAILVRPRRDADALERYIVPFLSAEAVDPNAGRHRLLRRVEEAHAR